MPSWGQVHNRRDAFIHLTQERTDVAANSLYDLFEYFGECYVINLPDRKDRWRDTQTELSKIGSPRVRRFNAIRPNHHGGFPSIGARGCFLSHLGVLVDAEQRGLTRVLILEDDISFTADFSVRASAEVCKLKSMRWDIFYGGVDFEGDEVPPCRAVQTTHFIGLHSPNISRLVKYLEAILTRPAGDPQGGPMHVDGAYSWYREQHPRVITVAASPPLGHQRSSRSDIHGRWFDTMPIMSQAVALIRRVKRLR